MWMKAAGAVLVILSCTGMGADAVRRMRERKRFLETMKRMVSHLKGEILYANAPLATAFLRTGKRGDGKPAELFTSVAERLEREPGENFEAIWAEQAETVLNGFPLEQKDRDQLLYLGKSLGYLDRDMQERTLLFYLEDTELALTKLRQEEPEKSRLFMGLGILSGLFLTVALI